MSTTQPYATMSDALHDWLQRHVAEGFEAEPLVASMVQSGYDRAFARRVVDEALAQRPAPAPVAPVPHPAPTEPEAANSNAVRTSDREIPILFAIETPRIVLFQHFLSDEECDELIALGRHRLKRSPVVNPETGEENLISARTSQGAMFQVGEHPLIARIEARIAQATGVPVEHGEGFQVLHYQPGGEYQPHFDYFNPGRSGEARQLEVGGQRVATLVIYLNSVQAGGATGFPKLGLEVAPVKGNAVFFVYKRPDGTLDDNTLPAGLPACRSSAARSGSPPSGCASGPIGAAPERAATRSQGPHGIHVRVRYRPAAADYLSARQHPHLHISVLRLILVAISVEMLLKGIRAFAHQLLRSARMAGRLRQ